MISCILLSAGLSQRFGSPKALAKLQDGVVIERIQKTLISSNIDEIIVVLGAYANEIKSHILNHKKVRFVYNKDYILGQTSSFKVGLREISPSSQGISLFPVDFPFIQAQTMDVLMKEFNEKSPPLLVPTYQGKRGHPPLFHVSCKQEILDWDDSVGINVFQQKIWNSAEFCAVGDPGVISTFNTAQELDLLKQSFRE